MKDAMTSIPSTMTAIGIKSPGGPEMLVPMERPMPQPGNGEILVKVAAAGVNRPDVMQRRGLYPPPPGVTDIPGLEIAGSIAACGNGVTRWKVGDEIAEAHTAEMHHLAPALDTLELRDQFPPRQRLQVAQRNCSMVTARVLYLQLPAGAVCIAV